MVRLEGPTVETVMLTCNIVVTDSPTDTRGSDSDTEGGVVREEEGAGGHNGGGEGPPGCGGDLGG